MRFAVPVASLVLGAVCACSQKPPPDRVRVSGQVEATDVQLAAQVGGRLLELHVAEGDRVKAGDVVAQLDVSDATDVQVSDGYVTVRAIAMRVRARAGVEFEHALLAQAHNNEAASRQFSL